jgi:cytochrome P450
MGTESQRINWPSLETAECPYPIFKDLREQGGVHRVPGENEFIVSSHELVSAALKTPEIFSSSTPLAAEAQPGWESSVFSSDPPDHTVKREIAYRSFNPGKLREYTPMIQSVVDELIDDFVDDGECEFVTQFANGMSSRVMFNILGLKTEDWAWSADIEFEGAGVRFLPPELQQLQDRDGIRLNEQMTAVVEERVQHPGDDAISHLIEGHRERTGEVTIPYLAAESTVLLLGGVLTSAHLSGSAMLLLLQHPEQMERVRADPKRIPRMLEEALRLESALQFMPRYVKADTELGGLAIPEGSIVLLVFAAANRDETTFEDAEAFDPERSNVKRHVGFGLGPHFCLGAPLARLEGKIAFETLFDRLGEIRLAEGSNDFRHIDSAFNRGPKSLYLEFDRAG